MKLHVTHTEVDAHDCQLLGLQTMIGHTMCQDRITKHPSNLISHSVHGKAGRSNPAVEMLERTLEVVVLRQLLNITVSYFNP